jgi:hypothetical protein
MNWEAPQRGTARLKKASFRELEEMSDITETDGEYQIKVEIPDAKEEKGKGMTYPLLNGSKSFVRVRPTGGGKSDRREVMDAPDKVVPSHSSTFICPIRHNRFLPVSQTLLPLRNLA